MSRQLLGAAVVLVIAVTPTLGDMRLLWGDRAARWWLAGWIVFAGYIAWHFSDLFQQENAVTDDTLRPNRHDQLLRRSTY